MKIQELNDLDSLINQIPMILRERPDTLFLNQQRGNASDFIHRVQTAHGLVADFDGTLHSGNQWEDLRRCMRTDLKQADEKAATKYFSDQRSDLGDIKFILNSVWDLHHSEFTKGQLTSLAHSTSIREGGLKLLQSFSRVAIISFGLKDFIEEWCDIHGCEAEIFALQVHWQTPNSTRSNLECLCLGGMERTVVSDANKGYMRDVFCASHNLELKELLILGDSPTDIKLMTPEAVNVLIVPHHDPQSDRITSRLRSLAEFWPNLSAILCSDSLKFLADIRQNRT